MYIQYNYIYVIIQLIMFGSIFCWGCFFVNLYSCDFICLKILFNGSIEIWNGLEHLKGKRDSLAKLSCCERTSRTN